MLLPLVLDYLAVESGGGKAIVVVMHLSKSCPTYPLPGTDRGLDRG